MDYPRLRGPIPNGKSLMEELFGQRFIFLSYGFFHLPGQRPDSSADRLVVLRSTDRLAVRFDRRGVTARF